MTNKCFLHDEMTGIKNSNVLFPELKGLFFTPSSEYLWCNGPGRPTLLPARPGAVALLAETGSTTPNCGHAGFSRSRDGVSVSGCRTGTSPSHSRESWASPRRGLQEGEHQAEVPQSEVKGICRHDDDHRH